MFHRLRHIIIAHSRASQGDPTVVRPHWINDLNHINPVGPSTPATSTSRATSTDFTAGRISSLDHCLKNVVNSWSSICICLCSASFPTFAQTEFKNIRVRSCPRNTAFAEHAGTGTVPHPAGNGSFAVLLVSSRTVQCQDLAILSTVFSCRVSLVYVKPYVEEYIGCMYDST